MSDTDWPWLPTELVERIIREAWTLPLSPKERTTLMDSSYLVNHTWQSLFVKINSADVHIACPAHAQRLFRILRRDDWVYSNPDYNYPDLDLICTSLTFTLDAAVYPIRSPRPGTSKMDVTICSTIDMLDTIKYLPNLYRLCIHHANWNEAEAFDQFRFTTFLPQITELEFTFSGPGGVTPVDAKILPSKYLQWSSLASITKVIISGASEGFIRTIVNVCPNVKTLQIDGTPKMPSLAPFPARIHKLIIKNPGIREGRIEGLVGAMLTKGLIEKSSVTPEVILEWGEVDSAAWTWFETMAKDSGVSISHQIIPPKELVV